MDKKIKFDDFVCSIAGIFTALLVILMALFAENVTKGINNTWLRSVIVIGFPLVWYAITAFTAIYTHNKKVEKINHPNTDNK